MSLTEEERKNSLILLVRHSDVGYLVTSPANGDIEAVRPGTGPVGTDEPRAYLVVRVPLPKQAEAAKQWLAPGPVVSVVDEEEIRRRKLYGMPNWASKFTPTDVDRIQKDLGLPDGPLVAGGEVVNGIVEGLFTEKNIRPKA